MTKPSGLPSRRLLETSTASRRETVETGERDENYLFLGEKNNDPKDALVFLYRISSGCPMGKYCVEGGGERGKCTRVWREHEKRWKNLPSIKGELYTMQQRKRRPNKAVGKKAKPTPT